MRHNPDRATRGRVKQPQALLGWLLVGLTAVIGLSACRNEPPPAKKTPRPIAWAVAEAVSDARTRSITGVLQAPERAPMGFEVPGRVARINVETGDDFAKGDVLATLDDRRYALTLTQREAELAEARSALKLARSERKRARNLLGSRAVSQAEYDNATAGVASSRSRVATLSAQIDLAAEDLADTRLIAPYDGTVAWRAVEPAQRIQAGDIALELQSRDDGMEVVTSVPETLINRLRRGSSHRVALPAAATETMTAAVTEIGTDARLRNAYPVMLKIEDPIAGARPGMTAEVALRMNHAETAGAPRARIPVAAVGAGEGQQAFVYVYDKDDQKLHRRDVTVAKISGDRALIQAGLEPGEIVASHGVAFLHDGQTVTRLGVGVARFND